MQSIGSESLVYGSKFALDMLDKPQTRFSQLMTRIMMLDPCVQGIHAVVHMCLYDHPYPKNKSQFYQRTLEICEQIKCLNFPIDRQEFLKGLITDTNVTLVDIWHGSHVIVSDFGYLYSIWSKLPFVVRRSSSHYRNISLQQYGISFGDYQLLFGKTNYRGSTWFQMEPHALDIADLVNNPANLLAHAEDYIKYRLVKLNIGPFGFSPHTERNKPLWVQFRTPIERLCNKKKVKRTRSSHPVFRQNHQEYFTA